MHPDTVARILVRCSAAAVAGTDHLLRDLPCGRMEVDEIWGYVGKKPYNMVVGDGSRRCGEFWTCVAIDPESKVIPAWQTSKRNMTSTRRFMEGLAARMRNRIQLSTDGLTQYDTTVRHAFGGEVDYGQVTKIYGGIPTKGKRTMKVVKEIHTAAVAGRPVAVHIRTACVERQNLTLRMCVRRLTRSTNAYSKRVERLRAALGLHFAHFNFCRVHETLGTTPAVALGIAERPWSLGELEAA
ncbi:IS1 family transposase [bacterium]|nr:IS1 family transposase [bacterium]